jgi:predicted transcriptional regulator
MRRELMAAIRKAFDKTFPAMRRGLGKDIINEWHNSNFEATHTDIATKLHTTQSYVSQVIKTFQHKLKQELEDYL